MRVRGSNDASPWRQCAVWNCIRGTRNARILLFCHQYNIHEFLGTKRPIIVTLGSGQVRVTSLLLLGLWLCKCLLVRIFTSIIRVFPPAILTWLGMSPICRQHVGPTAKCRHIWRAWSCRGNTKWIPTQHFCVGDCQHSPNFLYVPELHTKKSS
jgi:hypothetical protein